MLFVDSGAMCHRCFVVLQVITVSVLVLWPSLAAVQASAGGSMGPGPGPGLANSHPALVASRRPPSSPSSCPSCSRAHDSDRHLADVARLEAIKRQILSKLGLSARPNVTAAPSRDVVLETLLRAEETLEPVTRSNSGQSLSSTSNSAPASGSSGGSSLDRQSLPHNNQNNHDGATEANVDDETGAKTSEIIAFAEPGPLWNGKQTLLEFSHAKEKEQSIRVTSAMLWVDLQHTPTAHNQHHSSTRPFRHHKPNMTLYVFTVQPPHADKPLHFRPHDYHHRNATTWSTEQDGDLELVSSHRFTIGSLGWLKLNVTAAVHKWFNAPGAPKLRLLVDCAGCGKNVHPVLFGPSITGYPDQRPHHAHRHSSDRRYQDRTEGSHSQDRARHQRPFLVIRTETFTSHRLRRRALECTPTTKACCKQRFFVSFSLLGWDDWIIAPSGYYANYCRGDCGGAHRTPDTFLNYHSHVLEEFRRMDHAFPDLQPCCAPTKFSSMSLIYFGPDMNIIKRDLPKMVVDECGCP